MKKMVYLLSAAWCACLLSHQAAAGDPAADTASAQASTQSASAATSDQASLAQLSEVVVTAQRRKEAVDKVPISISAFTGKQLIDVGINNVQDLPLVTPGLNIATSGEISGDQFVIRGQSAANVGNGSPGVLIYQNDVPLPTDASLIQSYDMDNIEVLKGPQGTLFGRNSIGGAVLTYTKQPTWGYDGYAMMDVGSYDYRQFEGAQNIPIIDHKVALRVAAQVGSSAGDVTTYVYGNPTITLNPDGSVTAIPGALIPSTHNADAYARESFRASLLIQPTDQIKSITVVDHSEVRGNESAVNLDVYPNGYQGGSPALYFLPPSVISAALGGGFFGNAYASITQQLAQCGTSPDCDARLAGIAYADALNQRVEASTQNPWESRTVLFGVANTTSIEFAPGQTFKNIFGYHTTDDFQLAPLTGLPIPILDTSSGGYGRQYTDEAQFSGAFLKNGALKYTTGYFLFDDAPPQEAGGLEVDAYYGLSHTLAGGNVHNQSHAVYGQLDYSLDSLGLHGVTLTGGLRQTWDMQSACTTSETLSPFGPVEVVNNPGELSAMPADPGCLASNLPAGWTTQSFPDAKFSNLSYNLGVSWQVTDDDMLYVTRRTGYRAGGYNTPQVDPYLESVQTFKPETLAAWEVGAKTRWHFGAVPALFNVALFSGKDSNNQLPVPASETGQGVCIPQAIGSGGRAADCTTTSTEAAVYAVGTPGVLVSNAVNIFNANAATLTISGFEAEGDISPARWLTLGANGSFVNVKLDSINVPSALNIFVRAAGLPIPNSISIADQPKWTGNANATFRYPRAVLGGDLNATLNFHYNASYGVNGIIVPAYTYTNLRINLEDIVPNFRVTAYVNNLFNTLTYQGGAGSSPESLGEISYSLGPPRVIGLEVAYSWGGGGS